MKHNFQAKSNQSKITYTNYRLLGSLLYLPSEFSHKEKERNIHAHTNTYGAPTTWLIRTGIQLVCALLCPNRNYEKTSCNILLLLRSCILFTYFFFFNFKLSVLCIQSCNFQLKSSLWDIEEQQQQKKKKKKNERRKKYRAIYQMLVWTKTLW